MYIYYISLIPVICNRKLTKKKTEASISPISFRFTEQRNVEITYLIEMSLTISVAMSFLSAFFLPSFLNTINAISTKNVEFDSDGSISRS